MENHIPYGIIQRYLPPGSDHFPAFTPAKAGTQFSAPEGCKAELSCSKFASMTFCKSNTSLPYTEINSSKAHNNGGKTHCDNLLITIDYLILHKLFSVNLTCSSLNVILRIVKNHFTFCAVGCQENHWSRWDQMSDFKAEMHQNWFWLGLQDPMGEHIVSPKPSSWNEGNLLLS